MDYNKKQIFKQQKMLGRLNEKGNFPSVILLDTISHCNLKCSMCVHVDMEREKGCMSRKLFTKLIDEIALENNSVRVWMIFFGEPFVKKRKKPTIFDMIKHAKEKGLEDVVVNSNGNLMEEDDARRIIESGLDAIYFGIDAHSKETYDIIRVGGDHEKVIKNIKRLISLKKEMGSATPDIFVQFVEMENNFHEKEDFIKFWNDAGAKVKIRPKVSWAGMIDAPNLTMGNEERWPCHWGMQTLSVTDQGKVVTCAVDLDARFIAGDVNNQTIKEIWNGKLAELRNMHINGDFDSLPENCRNCRDWQSARSDYNLTNN